VINIRGNSYRLKGKLAEKEVEEFNKVNGCGSNLTTENGSILNDR
jgi:hypothetical protein